jgi:hypothetical protein
MAIDNPDHLLTEARKGQWFRAEASEVLTSLRNSVADTLSELGNFTKPAEVQRSLRLDKTLSRQVFKLACTSEAMASGNVVPSRTSILRFLDVAKGRGIGIEKVQGVLAAYEQFERLIQTHAGDRVTFNSMVAAAAGVDDEWLASDAQHRRNAFRALSHTMGVQIKTRLQLFIINGEDGASDCQVAAIGGCIGLRVLRPMPSVRVHGIALSSVRDPAGVFWEPLGLTSTVGGHLLDPFCSKPLPALNVSEGNDRTGIWRSIEISQPEVGNLGTSTLIFGTVCHKLPIAGEPMRVHSRSNKPTEVLILDVLVNPRLFVGKRPSAQGLLGNDDMYGSEVMALPGKFEPELLGRGPSAVATAEVPHYSDMVSSVGDKLGWDLSGYSVWRLRVENPLYQSTVSMNWAGPNP